MRSVSIDQMGKVLAQELQTWSEATAEDVEVAINETAAKAAEIVKEGAKHFGMNYANDIKLRKGRLRYSVKRGGTIMAYVTAGNHYRVAHLLEHGHVKIAGGRVKGYTAGVEHFAKGQDYIDRNLVENLRKELSR